MKYLPPAGSPAADALIEALSQYVSNQEEYLDIANPKDSKEVERTKVARKLLEQLEREFSAAVGCEVQS